MSSITSMLIPAIFYHSFYMNQVTDKLYHVNYYNNIDSLFDPIISTQNHVIVW
jgi:hypothetical protein